MILSTKGRYAVMALADLAACGESKPVTLAAIAERQEIPLAYLEQIFARLRKGGLIVASRGPGGGYRLSHPADDISIAEIILAADESIRMTRCEGHGKPGCMKVKTRCLTHDLWQGLEQQIHAYLSGITLADLCNGKLGKAESFGVPPQPMLQMPDWQ